MAITTITDLKTNIGVGARSNLFRVTIPTFQGVEIGNNELVEKFSYLCKGAQLPGSTLGLIEVPFQAGRRYKLAGDRTFPEWTTTIINDSDFKIREALETLQKTYGVADYNLGTAKSVTGASVSDFITLDVEQYDLAGSITCRYKLQNCWPLDISTIDLSYDSTDTIEEFTVTWAYDYYTTEFDPTE